MSESVEQYIVAIGLATPRTSLIFYLGAMQVKGTQLAIELALAPRGTIALSKSLRNGKRFIGWTGLS